jgi:hypothetical protein
VLHPRLTPLGAALGGPSSQWLASIGPFGTWDNLAITTRWGQGASGMYEVSWSMALPAGFDHPLLRRGTAVEIMDGAWRVGSPLILSQPGKGSGYDQPWTLTATGIGREVEGSNSFYALDGSGNVSATPSVVAAAAIARPSGGWRIDGYDAATVPSSALTATPSLIPAGELFSASADAQVRRWSVGQDNLLRFLPDPAAPLYEVTPGVETLGTADDDYATVVITRYMDSTTHAAATKFSPSSIASNAELTFGRREFAVDLIVDQPMGEIPGTTAQAIGDGILAKAKGRLAWANGLSGLTSNEITIGGVPANLSKVLEDVGEGCMVRLHGVWSDLLEYNGQTWLDVIIGEAKYADGTQTTIDLNPLGLVPRDLSAVIESVTGMAA